MKPRNGAIFALAFALGLGAAGCGGDSSGSTGTGSRPGDASADAGPTDPGPTDPGAGDRGTGPGPADEGGEQDTAKPAVDVPVGPSVGVLVYEDGKPLADAPVAFHDADGQVKAEARTDSLGRASAPAGGLTQITVGMPDGSLTTVQGVEEGDEVVVGMPQVLSEVAAEAAVRSSVAVPNTALYVVELGAAIETATELSAPLRLPVKAPALRAAGTFSVLAHTRDADSVPVAYAFARGQAPVEGAPAEVLLEDWSTQFGEIFVRVHDAPTMVHGVLARAAPVADDIAYYGLNAFSDSIPAATNVFLFGIPTDFGEAVEYLVTLAHHADGYGSNLVVRDSSRPNEVDVEAGSLLPRVDGVAVTRPEPARYAVTWSEDQALAASDGLLVEISNGEGSWLLLSPPGAEGVTTPALPETMAGRGPLATPSAAAAVVTFVEADYIPDYRALRADHGPAVLVTPFGRDDVRVRHSSGRALLP